jgi:hypothetical protein
MGEAESIVFIIDDDPLYWSSSERLVRSVGFSVLNVPAIAEQRLAQSQAWQVLQLKRAEAAEITARPPAEKVGAPTMTEEERRAAERQARSRFMHGAGTKPKLPPR